MAEQRRTGGREGRQTALVALATLFVVVQILLPVLVWARAGVGPRDFSWDMFSHYVECRRFEARVVGARSGVSIPFDLGRDFSSWAQLSRLLVPGRLETYSSRLCSELQTRAAEPVQLHWDTACRSTRSADFSPLLDARRDYCRTSR